MTRPGGAVKDSASNTLCVPYTLVSSSTSITPSPRGKWWPGPPRAGSSPDNRRRGDGRERTKWSTAATKVVTFARGACDVRDLPNLVLMGNTDEEVVTEHTGTRSSRAPKVVTVLLVVLALANGLFCVAIMPGEVLAEAMVGTVVMAAASSMALLGDWWPLTAGLVLVAVCVLLLSVDSVWRDLAQEGGLIWTLVVAVWAGTNLVSRAHAPHQFALGGVALAAYVAVATAVAMSDGTFLPVSVLNAAAPVLFGVSISLTQRLVAARHERARQEARERVLLAERARADERRRLASEMHDVVSHQVSLIVLRAGAPAMATRDPEARTAADSIRTAGSRAIDELRAIIGVLHEDRSATPAEHPDTLPSDQTDSGPDFTTLVEEARVAGQRVEFAVSGDTVDVPTHAARAAYRLVQEGLTNARKHAPGASVAVKLRHRPDAILVEVVNSAPTADPDPVLSGSGTGLEGLRQRVELLGGTLTSGPDEVGGFALRAILPNTGAVENEAGSAP